jgi:polyisoprenyl-phosphate glycosyltransferase
VSPEISVVVPLHNEAENLLSLVHELEKQLAGLSTSWELVLVDDGSTDGTGERLRALAASRTGIEPVHLSRNFGKENALAAGLSVARGRAVIVMDGDLQHPPSLLPALVERWRNGADVVNAVKRDRGRESLAYKGFSRLFYFLIGGAIGRQMEGQSDYKLLDRQVVDQINALEEQHRFFRGLVAWIGFRVEEVPFEVAERAAGRTNFTSMGLVRYAVGNLMAFSSLPLQLIAWLGFVTTGLAVILAIDTLGNWIIGHAVDGFTTAILATLIMGGVNLFCLGIVALYQSVMYDELKRRPGFVIRREEHAPRESVAERELRSTRE